MKLRKFTYVIVLDLLKLFAMFVKFKFLKEDLMDIFNQ